MKLTNKSKKQNLTNNHYYGGKELESNEDHLPRYNEFIVKKFIQYSNLPFLNTMISSQRILDFGAGTGTLAVIYKRLTGRRVECFEIDKAQFEETKKKGFVSWNSFAQILGKYDYIYSSNVLEHIENDLKCLSDLREILAPGCRLSIYVPAFNILFSDLDRSVGHYRRYSRKELKNKVIESGLKVVTCQYVDSLGFFASLFIKIFGWRKIGNIGGSASLKLYDKVIFPVSRIIDRVTCGKFFGKNLLLIAEK